MCRCLGLNYSFGLYPDELINFFFFSGEPEGSHSCHSCHSFGLYPDESFLSLGRVDPAPHTQHLLGPFEAKAQNSLLRSFSIVDSLANRQHSCRGSEELAIRFQATPTYCGGHLSRTPNYAEFLDPNQGTRSTSLGTWQACSCGVVALALAFTLGMALQGKL